MGGRIRLSCEELDLIDLLRLKTLSKDVFRRSHFASVDGRFPVFGRLILVPGTPLGQSQWNRFRVLGAIRPR